MGASHSIAHKIAQATNVGGETVTSFSTMYWIWRGSTNRVCPDSCNLKLSNRPVRTRMPGGVAGEQDEMPASHADLILFLTCALPGKKRPMLVSVSDAPLINAMVASIRAFCRYL